MSIRWDVPCILSSPDCALQCQTVLYSSVHTSDFLFIPLTFLLFIPLTFCSYLWPSVHTSDLLFIPLTFAECERKEGQVNHCKLNLPIGQWFAKLQNFSLRSNDVLLHIRPECCTTSILNFLATLATLLDFCLALNQLMQEIPSCFCACCIHFHSKTSRLKVSFPSDTLLTYISLLNLVFNLKNNLSTCSGTVITVLRTSGNFPETGDNG